MLLLTLRDLQHRRSRVAVVIMLVALILTLLYLMSGLVNQLKTEPGRAVDAVSANHWLLADGVTGPFTAISVLPLEAAQTQLSSNAEPVVVSRSSVSNGVDAGRPAVLFGHQPGAATAPTVTSGRSLSGSGEVVVDETLDVALGDRLWIAGEEVTVVGTTRDTTVLAGIPFVFTDLASAQELAFQSDRVVSAFVANGPISVTEGPVQFAEASREDVIADTQQPIESAVASIGLIRGLLWVVAAIVVGAVVYLSALERTRDFAILKAVGARGRALGSGLALQAVIIALTAAVLGGGLAFVIQPFFPLPAVVPAASFWQVPLVAVAIGLLAATVGVRKVNRTDPAAAFGGAA